VFLFRLAAALGMTVRELETRMDSRELSEWLAVHRFFMPLPDPWRQTGVLASAALAPYTKPEHAPASADFVPIEQPPKHPLQVRAALADFAAELEGR
jgi:hypothetical protein